MISESRRIWSELRSHLELSNQASTFHWLYNKERKI